MTDKKQELLNDFEKFIQENAIVSDISGWDDGGEEAVVVFGPDIDVNKAYPSK